MTASRRADLRDWVRYHYEDDYRRDVDDIVQRMEALYDTDPDYWEDHPWHVLYTTTFPMPTGHGES